MTANAHLNIVGGGLAGALLATLLAQRGYDVDVYERRADPRSHKIDAGRSINLALASRGLIALQAAGLSPRIEPLLIPMRGRMLHQAGLAEELQSYGSRAHEVIWSVSRAALNRALIDAAAEQPRVRLHFETGCESVQPSKDVLSMKARSGALTHCPLGSTIATDGGGSTVRHALQAAGLLQAREELLDHDYKELEIAATTGLSLDPNALHIWPRGDFMLIALPNPDHSFTATLFLSKRADPGFDSLQESCAVSAFFDRFFPDVGTLIPNLTEQFQTNPQGILGTVHCDRWHVGGQLLLLGDAAHAIVPFHGQGANCAFEDCLTLAKLLDAHGRPPATSMQSVFEEFEQQRRPNAEAIAQMALENYTEMRDTVRDERFVRRKALSLLLEQRYPTRFIPRYSMVMFHAEISYSEALRRGRVQEALLDDLERSACSGSVDSGSVDSGLADCDLAHSALADRLIMERLTPIQPAS